MRRESGDEADEAQMARECGGVVLPHNHPASVPPSYRDFLTAASEENVKASVILGHDGSVWFAIDPQSLVCRNCRCA